MTAVRKFKPLPIRAVEPPPEGMPDGEFFGDDVDYTDADAPSGRTCQIGDHVELARWLVTDLGGADNLVFDELHPWRYDGNGLWPKIDRSEPSRIVQGYSGTPVQPSGKPLKVKLPDVVGSTKLAFDVIARPGFFAEAPAGIAFSNGFVRVTETGEIVLEPHAREHRARAGYSFPYEARALPRRFLTFLSDLFRDDADRADKESFVQEFFGACVLGIAPRYQRACIATGEGANGKSTLAEVAIGCMPEGTTSAIAPQDLGQEYRRAMLVGKHLNAVNELPDRDIIASEAFKGIVTGDPIVGRVIRESPLMFRPKAGHFFAANRLPGTSDQSEGFWRRFVVLTFNRSFKDDPTCDPQIGEKLAAERPAIVSWLVDGAARVVREKGYTIPSSHHAALAEWRKNADQVALFVESELRPLRVDEPIKWGTPGATLYQSYRQWSERNGHRAMASNRFADRMQALDLAAKKTSRGMVYPVVVLTAADRERGVQGGAGKVQGDPSQLSAGEPNG